MKRRMMALGTLAVIMTNTGCTSVVIEPQRQASDGGTDGGIVATAGSASVVAILARDVPPALAGTKQGMVATAASGVDPDALVLMFSNLPEACANPVIGSTCPDPFTWQRILVLPPDLVRVGLVDLGNPRIASYAFIIFDNQGGLDGTQEPCAFENDSVAPLSSGTMEIVSTDAGSITVNLIDGIEGVPAFVNGFNGAPTPMVTLKGTFTIPRCDAAPPPPPPGAAVVLRGAQLPAGLPPSATIGATVDPTALYVFLGTGTQTCSDPLSPLGCGPARLMLRIPAALQHPGTLDLSDPQLAASAQISADGTASCTASSGSVTMGTLTITSIDASGISFSLLRSLTGPSFDADGLYQATICP
jgi:hypothetical protein